MARLGYKDRGSFLAMVKREALPHIFINSRRIVFPVLALEQWEAKRAVGTIR